MNIIAYNFAIIVMCCGLLPFFIKMNRHVGVIVLTCLSGWCSYDFMSGIITILENLSK